MTNILQPADVCWFAPLKKSCRKDTTLKVRTFNVVMPHWDHAVPGPQFSSFKAASQYQILSLSATLIITSFYGRT